ncbi:hypothetical protein [Oceanirhabdus sp. W0125-5]|uniref:hypothetical protein n=1 Tax=Oceanirhabdus sp. W0125-5 TaxID=2999116 RepID=UPI0022F2F250|nr:hypothetical protein [Oceanirhabdus sp. W0125-5]WBW97561.1 hypothetical protein OW730_01785 [Oceanirhabdus sp. W0125-5]
MSEKNINNNEISYDKDDILKEIEKELRKNKELKVDDSNDITEQSKGTNRNKKINKILSNKNDLVKGILLSEILGKPKGRR